MMPQVIPPGIPRYDEFGRLLNPEVLQQPQQMPSVPPDPSLAPVIAPQSVNLTMPEGVLPQAQPPVAPSQEQMPTLPNRADFRNSKLRTVLNAIAGGLAGAGGGARAGYQVGSSLRDQPYDQAMQDYANKTNDIATRHKLLGDPNAEFRRQQALRDTEDIKGTAAVNVYSKQKEIDTTEAAKTRKQIKEERQLALANDPQLQGITPEQQAEYLATGKVTPEAQRNLQKVQIKMKDTGQIVDVYANPRTPGVLTTLDGQPIATGTYTPVNVSEEAAKTRLEALDPTARATRALIAAGYPDSQAKRIAGQMIAGTLDANMRRTLQSIGINTELSGVGGGSGLPTPNAQPAAQTPPERQPGPYFPKVSKPVTPVKSGTAPVTSGKTPIPPETTNPNYQVPLAFNDQEQKFINMYLGSVLSNQPGAGSAAEKVGKNKGMMLLASKLGVDPMSLQADASTVKALGKQLGETIQRAGAIQRLNNTLDYHGKLYTDAVKTLQDSGSPLLNKPIRELSTLVAGNPEYRRFKIAANAIEREYGYLTAGGAQSRAMLPAGVSKKMEGLFPTNITVNDALAVLDQVKLEAAAETAAMKQTQTDMINQMKSGLLGSASSGEKVNQKRTPSGRTFTIQED